MEKTIQILEQMKAEIEWDYSLEYQVTLEKVIELLRYIDGFCEKNE